MSTVKPRKDSLVDFIERFSKEDKQINFFLNLKWPNGFSCDKCDCHDYYLVKRKNVKNGYLFICRKCGHQHSLLAHTIFQDSNLLIGLYVFFSSNSVVNGNQLANYMDVNVKIARKFSKKCRILMAESNITKFIL
ncbi:Transposase zinc-ribbon domain-containing protein [Kandleria vitulina]|uniref:Transposase zinc-ribbon domain-containing protein n=1 Tax=Kandleria vitulina TaxID=1630 RepID=A0A1H2W7J3_9FIRM|nr:Transposase zinc-ribbon domain-containing protein [Kandleria vitulina]